MLIFRLHFPVTMFREDIFSEHGYWKVLQLIYYKNILVFWLHFPVIMFREYIFYEHGYWKM